MGCRTKKIVLDSFATDFLLLFSGNSPRTSWETIPGFQTVLWFLTDVYCSCELPLFFIFSFNTIFRYPCTETSFIPRLLRKLLTSISLLSSSSLAVGLKTYCRNALHNLAAFCKGDAPKSLLGVLGGLHIIVRKRVWGYRKHAAGTPETTFGLSEKLLEVCKKFTFFYSSDLLCSYRWDRGG